MSVVRRAGGNPLRSCVHDPDVCGACNCLQMSHVGLRPPAEPSDHEHAAGATTTPPGVDMPGSLRKLLMSPRRRRPAVRGGRSGPCRSNRHSLVKAKISGATPSRLRVAAAKSSRPFRGPAAEIGRRMAPEPVGRPEEFWKEGNRRAAGLRKLSWLRTGARCYVGAWLVVAITIPRDLGVAGDPVDGADAHCGCERPRNASWRPCRCCLGGSCWLLRK